MSTIGYYICVPFAWLVRLFYNLTGSYGVALILFTLVIKLIMLPFQMKSKKSMLRMNRLSGQMKDIQKRYANNQVKMNEEMQKLYAEEGLPHPHCSVLHHPSAHHPFHDAAGICGGDPDPDCHQGWRQHGQHRPV